MRASKMGRGSKRYMTKKMVRRASKSGAAQASRDTMLRMGQTVIVQGDWVVRKHADGRIEQISPLNRDTFSSLDRLVD